MPRKRNNEYTEEELKIIKEKRQQYYQLNKEKIKQQSADRAKEYYLANKEQLIQKAKERYQSDKDNIKKKVKIYRDNNKEKSKITRQQYEAKNKVKRAKTKKEYQAKRRQTDALYRLKHNLRVLIQITFKNKQYDKFSKTADILGCTYEEFKAYIEAKFLPWMNWDNYGNPKDGIYEKDKTWDLDHIIPIATAKTKEELIRLNHYTNYQPLCSHVNRFIKRNETK